MEAGSKIRPEVPRSKVPPQLPKRSVAGPESTDSSEQNTFPKDKHATCTFHIMSHSIMLVIYLLILFAASTNNDAKRHFEKAQLFMIVLMPITLVAALVACGYFWKKNKLFK